jgi:hypothetical protein
MHTKALLPALFPFLFLACDTSTVPKAEYDALLSEKQQLEGLNDSLQFELSSLKTYVELLEEDNAALLIEELQHTPCD